jgi:hypothetical protein
MAELRAVVRTPLRRNQAFKAWWKSCTGLLLPVSLGEMSLKAYGIAVGVSFAVGSWEILFGVEESWREASPPAGPAAPPDPQA